MTVEETMGEIDWSHKRKLEALSQEHDHRVREILLVTRKD